MEKTHLDPRNAHQRQQLAALLVVLPRDLDLTTVELVDVLGGSCDRYLASVKLGGGDEEERKRTRLLRLDFVLLRLGAVRETLPELRVDNRRVSTAFRRTGEKREERTYDIRLELRRFPIKDVARLEVVLDHPDRAVEQSHQVTCRLPSVVHELLTVLLPHRNQELVDAHRTAHNHRGELQRS